MSKSICDSSVPAISQQPWNSVDYSFDKDRFTFLVDNIRDSEYGRKLKQLSADINAAKGDYSVFEHIAYIYY